MLFKKQSRREFLRLSAGSIAIFSSCLVIQSKLQPESGNYSVNIQKIIKKEYLVVSGWVLLKNDLTI